MSRPTLDMLVISHGRPKEAAMAIASAENQGFERVLLLDNGTEPPLLPIPGAELFRSDENLGAAGGRNLLATEATADAFVFIDDDVTLEPGAASAIADVLESDPEVVGCALRVERADGSMLPHEQVFRLGMTIPRQRTPCSYFVGIGFAMRRQAFVDLGGFDARMFYGSEEIDFAFRALRAGHRFAYEPRAVCIHRPSSAGRLPTAKAVQAHLANRVQLARTHLPAPVAAIHIAAWSALLGRQALAARALQAVPRGIRDGFNREIARDPLPVSDLRRVHKIGGRVLF